MYRKMRHVLVVMAVAASLLLFGVVPAYAHDHDHDDLDDVLDKVHELVDDVVHDILDGLEDLDLH